MRVLTALALVLALLAVTPPSTLSARERELARKNPLPSYFPLEVGNWWLYEGRLERVSVRDRVTAPNGQDYFVLDGHLGERRVRASRSDVVSELDPGGGQDFLWYMLGAPVGTTWTFQLAPRAFGCISGVSVTVASRSDVVRVPAGEFRNVVRLEWGPNGCEDFAIEAEWYAPGVGLIRLQEITIIGIEVSELLDAQVGGVQVRHTPYETSLSMESPFYAYNLFPPVGSDPFPTVRAVFTLRNESDIPLQLSFLGCKSVTFSVLNDAGVEMLNAKGYDYSCRDFRSTDPVDFTLAQGSLAIWGIFKLKTQGGSPLPDGRYTLVATLNTVDPVPLRPSARAVFDVTTTQ